MPLNGKPHVFAHIEDNDAQGTTIWSGANFQTKLIAELIAYIAHSVLLLTFDPQ